MEAVSLSVTAYLNVISIRNLQHDQAESLTIKRICSVMPLVRIATNPPHASAVGVHAVRACGLRYASPGTACAHVH